jgi:paraquat-inducible protein B
MNEEAKYFRIGLFVVIAATIFVALLVTFGVGRVFEDRVFFETYVKGSVQGIDKGSPVKFRGVTIGQVSQVTFVFNEYPAERESGVYNYVLVLMEVTKPVFPNMFNEDLDKLMRNAIERGLRARIEPVGITGMNYIEIDYLDPEIYPALAVDWKPRHHYIPSAPGQLTSILDSINSIMRDVQNFKLSEMGNDLLILLRNLNSTVQSADRFLKSTDFAALTQDIRALVTRLDETLSEVRLGELSSSARLTLDQIALAVADLKRILANIEPVTRINSDDVNSTITNLRVISDNLRVLSGDLRRYPSRLIWGGPPPSVDLLRSESHPDLLPGPVRGKRKP